MDPQPVNLPTHKHPLYRSSRFIYDCCDGCLKFGPIQEGYRCNDSECSHVWFHKECAEAPLTLRNHSFRLQHSLVLTQFTDYRSDCDLCGKRLKSYTNHGRHSTTGYRCSECDFKVDLECTIKPQSLVIMYPMFHDHLVFLKDHRARGTNCGTCKKRIFDKNPYGCYKCDVNFHVECVNLAPEVNYIFHSKHPLTLVKSESLSSRVGKMCVLCGAESEALLYHCSTCNFSVCIPCTTSPPRLAIEHQKTHEHQLSLMPSRISFACNACGMIGNQSPYLCLLCGFSFHRGCIDLPRVININRHEHRVSLIHQLGPRYDSSCGVCHKSINPYFGGYACSVCPSYAVHSLCAVRNDVWEGIELEHIPEEIEDIAPFIVVGDNLIKHFSHQEHNLRFNESTIFHDESTRCKACVRPVYSDPIYECEQCDFILHKQCANLPKKKRLIYYNKPFTLLTTNVDSGNHFQCSSCDIVSSGFRYVSGNISLDTLCGSFCEPFMHDGHLHPLYFNANNDHNLKCSACLEKIQGNALHCDTCEFRLHFHCANMTIRVKSKYDDHPLFLCYGEKATGKYWCDICEMETDPAKWFYTCSDCGVTLHVECVLGDFSHLMPGSIIEKVEDRFEVVSNNQNSCRPFCTTCKSRCKVPNILRSCDQDYHVCSKKCLTMREDGRKLTLEEFLVMASVVKAGSY